jgi:hypothetical protein
VAALPQERRMELLAIAGSIPMAVEMLWSVGQWPVVLPAVSSPVARWQRKKSKNKTSRPTADEKTLPMGHVAALLLLEHAVSLPFLLC